MASSVYFRWAKNSGPSVAPPARRKKGRRRNQSDRTLKRKGARQTSGIKGDCGTFDGSRWDAGRTDRTRSDVLVVLGPAAAGGRRKEEAQGRQRQHLCLRGDIGFKRWG